MIDYIKRRKFKEEVIDKNLDNDLILDEVLAWIKKHVDQKDVSFSTMMEPEDVFSTKELESWAYSRGFDKNDD